MKPALLLLCGVAACHWRSAPPPDASPQATVPTTDDAGRLSHLIYPAAPASFVDLVRDARRSVVAIRAGNPVQSGPAAMYPGATPTKKDVALGTGFLIHLPAGTYVVTNDHVIADVTDLSVVTSDGAELKVKIAGREPRLDVALLSIDDPGAPRLPTLRFADSDKVQVGEWVVALGNPFGEEVTASAGIVSATGREASGSLVPGTELGFRTYIQVDARINRGNSGGPILTTAGEVLGLAVATSDHVEELSFVLPANHLSEILEPLRAYGSVRRAWVGALGRPVTMALAEQLHLPKVGGALITEVKVGSPAIKIGLRPGDVIVSWDDKPVDHRNLPWLAANAPIGKPVKLTIWRDSAAMDLNLTPEPMPE